MRGFWSLWNVQSFQVSGMSVRSPKNNSSRCLEPKVVSSTPIRDSVTSKTTVFADQRFAGADVDRIFERGLDAGVFLLLPVCHQKRGQGLSFVVGKPQ